MSKEVREARRQARAGGQSGPGAGRERTERTERYTRDELPLEPVHPPRTEYQEREQPGQGRGYNYRGEDRADRSSQYSWEPLPRSARGGEDSRGPRYSSGYRR